MKNILSVSIALLLSACGVLAQGAPSYRNQFGTNLVMNESAKLDGWVSVWNSAAGKWSNTVITANQTNIPAYLQTATLTNLQGTGLNFEATNTAAHIESASSGRGTNTTFINAITNRGNFFVSSNSTFTGTVTVVSSTTTAGLTNSSTSTNAGQAFFGSSSTQFGFATNAVGFVTKPLTGSGFSGFYSFNFGTADYYAMGYDYLGFSTTDHKFRFRVDAAGANTLAFEINDSLANRSYIGLAVDAFLTCGNDGVSSFTANGTGSSFAHDLTIQGPFIANDSLRVPRGASVTTDAAGEVGFDTDIWAASRGALQVFDGTANTYVVAAVGSPSDGQVPVWRSGGVIGWENQSGSGGGGGGPFNTTQFDASSSVTNIKNGAVLTNVFIYTALTMPTLTANRVVLVNSSGQITNSAAVDSTELEFLDGVTSAIQTQLNGKQAGGSNANQFGAAPIMTLKDGAVITNLVVVGALNVTNPPATVASFRIWNTNGLSYNEWTLPAGWQPTNKIVSYLTNLQAGQVFKVSSVSVSSGIATIVQTNDFVAGTEVTFADPDNAFVATSVSAAIAELNDNNASGPNASDGKVHWSQLVGVPAGFADGTDNTGSTSTNNLVQGVGYLDVTNSITRWWVHLGDNTNVVVDWSKTNYYICSPSNVFAVSWLNTPAAGSHAQTVYLEVVNTNSTAGFFPTNGLNNANPILLAAPSTNTFAFQFDGTNFWVESGQILSTGTGDTNVFNISPALHSAWLRGRTQIDAITNLLSQSWDVNTRLIFTNNAMSNIVVSFVQTNYLEIWTTNNLTFTNWVGIADDAQAASVTVIIRPQLINRGVNWGNLGLSNPGYGVAIATNQNSPMWTTLTNAKTYALALTRVRTNIFATLTLWE